jgi:hypothetical protein
MLVQKIKMVNESSVERATTIPVFRERDGCLLIKESFSRAVKEWRD